MAACRERLHAFALVFVGLVVCGEFVQLKTAVNVVSSPAISPGFPLISAASVSMVLSSPDNVFVGLARGLSPVTVPKLFAFVGVGTVSVSLPSESASKPAAAS